MCALKAAKKSQTSLSEGSLALLRRQRQQVLDVALAFSVINRHFDVADFLLAHGADINTRWNSHEPASILHRLLWELRVDAIPHRPRHRYDHQGLPVEQ